MARSTSTLQVHQELQASPIVIILAIPAVGAALARDANGVSHVSEWLAVLLQAPLVILWSLYQTGLISQRGRAFAGPIDGVLTAIVAIGAGIMAIRFRSPGVFFTATTVLIAGQLLLEWWSGLYHRLDQLMLEPAGAVAMVARPWLLILIAGTILLSLPVATHSSVPDYEHNFWLHILNCAFTSTSAACLVGVGAYGFGDDLTLFGQVIVVLITQISGMAFAALGLAAIQPFLTRVIRLRAVLMTALIVQAAAIAILWSAWATTDARTPFQRLWWGVVHAGSAIWNSGWMLRSDGLAAYLGDSLVFTVITILAIVGSLGIPILLDLLGHTTGRGVAVARPLIRPAWRRLPQWEAGGALAMLVMGAALLFIFENPRLVPEKLAPPRPVDFGEGRVSIRDNIGPRARWSMSVFVSATLRSAGLQSIPLSKGAISWPTYGLMLAWMFIGGSAAGVAGGMRLTTILIIAMSFILERFPNQRPRITANREKPAPLRSRLGLDTHAGTALNRSSWIAPAGDTVRSLLLRATIRWFILWIFLTIIAILVLAATTDGSWYEKTFEAVAAVNGVGLSTGLSLHLTWAGRLTMIGMMILGRLLPIAFWIGLSLKMTVALRNSATTVADPA